MPPPRRPGPSKALRWPRTTRVVSPRRLDPLANKQIVEFYVSASDGSHTRTWPAASSEGQTANCTYQVDNEVSTGSAPYYRLVLTAAENAAYNALAAVRAAAVAPAAGIRARLTRTATST